MDASELEAAISRFVSSDTPSSAPLQQAFERGDAAQRGSILDAIAAEAAAGSVPCTELLLALVDHHRLAVPTIRRLVAGDAHVDDVTQDALVALAESIGTFRATSSFRTWFAGIARNQALQHVRSDSRRRQREAAIDEPRPAMRISSLVARREALGAVLDSLPDIYRDVVVLRDQQELTYEEIADELGIELNTVRSRLSRGRALVAASLAR